MPAPKPVPRVTPTSDLLHTLCERGLVHRCTDLAALDARLRRGPIVAYVGVDPAADALHGGHLAAIMMLRWLRRFGHRPVVLVGGATARLGGWSGTAAGPSAPGAPGAAGAAGTANLRATLRRFLAFGEGPTDAVLVDNAEWLDRLGYTTFLKTIGRHVLVNRMLRAETVRMRLAHDVPVSLLELNYIVLQAYDFVEMERSFDCVLQIGAAAQWASIVAGVELGARVVRRRLFGLVAPDFADATGRRAGAGPVWLDPVRLPADGLRAFWQETSGAAVGRCLRLFTDLPLAEIARLEALRGREAAHAKAALADAVVALCHGGTPAAARPVKPAETLR